MTARFYKIRFHLDEHIDPAIADALRRQGIDVTTTVEVGLRTKTDKAQWAFVRLERRVMVSHDPDFLRFAGETTNHPGIAFCHMGMRSVGEIIDSLILIYEVLMPEQMEGRVEYL